MSETVWLKPQQIEQMRDAAHTHSQHPHRDDAITTLLYDTGLRRSELSQLNRDMLDLTENQLRIPSEIQKQYPNDRTPNPVTFELDRHGSLRTIRTLRAYLNQNGTIRPGTPLFDSRTSNRISGKGVNDIIKRLAAHAQVRPYIYGGRKDPMDVTAHTLRHSVAYRMLTNGSTLNDVKKRLRHSSILTTERHYEHFQTV